MHTSSSCEKIGNVQFRYATKPKDIFYIIIIAKVKNDYEYEEGKRSGILVIVTVTRWTWIECTSREDACTHRLQLCLMRPAIAAGDDFQLTCHSGFSLSASSEHGMQCAQCLAHPCENACMHEIDGIFGTGWSAICHRQSNYSPGFPRHSTVYVSLF